MRRTTTRLFAAGAAASLALLTGCGGDDSSSGSGGGGGSEGGGSGEGSIDPAALEGQSITVGSKDFDEQLVLGQIALLAFEAAGADVTDSTNLQGTVAARAALTGGEIDTYWEYTGTGWITHLGETEPIPDSQEQYVATRDADLEQNNIAWLEPAPANNTYALAVAESRAEELGLETLSDWATYTQENPDEATICVESEFAARDDGLPGLEEAYGVDVPEGNVSLVDTGVVYTETANGNCLFGEVFTTDGRVAALDLRVLEDDQGFFPIYNPALTFQQSRLQELSGVEEVIAPISEALTTEVLTDLNARVSVDGELPEDVARDFLESEGFLSS